MLVSASEGYVHHIVGIIPDMCFMQFSGLILPYVCFFLYFPLARLHAEEKTSVIHILFSFSVHVCNPDEASIAEPLNRKTDFSTRVH